LTSPNEVIVSQSVAAENYHGLILKMQCQFHLYNNITTWIKTDALQF